MRFFFAQSVIVRGFEEKRPGLKGGILSVFVVIEWYNTLSCRVTVFAGGKQCQYAEIRRLLAGLGSVRQWPEMVRMKSSSFIN